MLLDMRRNRTTNHAPQHDDFEAKLFGYMLQFGDSFFGCVHRNDCRRGQSVSERTKEVCTKGVKRPASDFASLGVGNARKPKSGGRVEDSEIEAEFLHTFIQ